tara:strand:- start:12818 stop:13822 length:1005 start_codon:yes stop_codon:yes gene_type:complete
MTETPPRVSVVICTHNPDNALLSEVIAAIGAQADAPSYEVILVDNCSNLPVDPGILQVAGGEYQTCIREPALGLSQARKAGIEAASAELICFVDDDNILALDYLAEAVRIATEEPELGVFGGRSLGRFASPPGWLCRHFIARYAIREEAAPVTMTRPERHSRGTEPFGAGMIVRRPLAQAFADLVRAFDMDLPMGRKGGALGSGEDSLFSRIAYEAGYAAGYRPSLVLHHVITRERLRWPYLARLLEGQAEGEALLDAMDGIAAPIQGDASRSHLARRAARFARRFITVGPAEAIGLYFWDRGYNARSVEAKVVAERISSLIGRTRPNSPRMSA